MEGVVRRGDLKQLQILIRSGVEVNDQLGTLLKAAIEEDHKDIAFALLEAAEKEVQRRNGESVVVRSSRVGKRRPLKSQLNKQDVFGRTLLMMAAQSDNMALSLRLLQVGASCKGLSEDQVSGLLHHACLEGDESIVKGLIADGCNVNSVGAGGCTPLMAAARYGHEKVALVFLRVGANLDVHVKDNVGKTALHWACDKGLAELVRALIDRGSRVNEQDRYTCTPVMLAVQSGSMAIVMHLLRAGARCHKFTKDQMNDLLHMACTEGHVLVVENLITDGCDVNCVGASGYPPLIIAARYGHEGAALVLLRAGANVHVKDNDGQTALHWACERGKGRLVQVLIDRGAGVNEQDRFARTPLMLTGVSNTTVSMCLLRAGASCGGLSMKRLCDLYHYAYQRGDTSAVQTLLKDDGLRLKVEQENLLHHACRKGNAFVEVFIASGCNINRVDTDGLTPLMVAAHEGREEVVEKLILAGVDVRRQDKHGDTALHHAARNNNIQCGILLAEGGASVRIKSKATHTPLSIAKPEFKEAILQALSFTTRKTICIIGNAESGKSTLITALQAESTGFVGRTFNRFRRVSDLRRRTAGIEIITFCSQKYGEVLFFDFAGQHEYHGPHEMFLESLLSKPGVLMTLLLVVKATDEEDAILHQLHRWLSPVALMSTTDNRPQVIVIGSFLDKVRSKEEATAKLDRCISATKKNLDELPITFAGFCFLNCRQPQSQGIDQLCSLLHEIPIPEFRAAHTQYSLAWVLSQIRSSLKSRAVQLSEFSAWIEDNKRNLPQTMPPPEEVCQDLSAAGHTLYLSNKEDSSRSWLVLDLPSILHDVYGTLFSQPKATVNEFGLLHHQHLADLFQHLDLEMVHQILISLEFCIPVDPSVLEVEVSKLTQSEEASGWLFFPALITPKSLQPTFEGLQQQIVPYLCWQLKTSKKHYISARVLQTILLRLAAHFVVKQYDEEGAQQHCCSIWWNGIAWKSKNGIVVTVCITNNRVIQVASASKTSAENACRYLIDVISDILSVVHQLSPKLIAAAYIVHPPKLATSYHVATALSPLELFPVADIRNSIRDLNDYSFSLKYGSNYHSADVLVSDLFGGYTPSQEDVERINWTQPHLNQTCFIRSHAKDHTISGEVDPLIDPLDNHPQMELPTTPIAKLDKPPPTSTPWSTSPREPPTLAAMSTGPPLTPATTSGLPAIPIAKLDKPPLPSTAMSIPPSTHSGSDTIPLNISRVQGEVIDRNQE